MFGDTVRIKSDDGNVYRVTVAAPKIAKPSEFTTLGNKKLYASQVTIVGITGTTTVNPLYFKAQNSEGDSYDSALGDVDNQIDAGDVPAGSKSRGMVAFEVPPGQTITSISITDAILDTAATWHAAA